MKFEKACKELIVRDPFWGLFLLGINKKHSSLVDTLGVGPDGAAVTLYVNDSFWDTLSSDEQTAVLIHELEHLALDHLNLRSSFPDKELFNIAADMEVNCYIRNLPDGVFLASKSGYGERLGTKAYYDLLSADKRSDSYKRAFGAFHSPGGDKPGEKGFSGRGSHKLWKEADGMDGARRELMRSFIDGALVRAAKETAKSQGSVPGELKGIIDELLKEKERVYDWKACLRRVVTGKIDLSFRTTHSRQSVRFPGEPGIRLRRKASVLVAVDCSGSISDDELVEFFGEIEHIRRAGSHVHVLEFDAAVQDEWDYKGPRNIRISGRGGTDFSVVTGYWMEKRKDYSLLVMFTDGEAQPEDLAPAKKDLVWLVSSQGRHDHDYPGKVIFIPKQ